jgi:outer membrane immunogenic protein
MTKTRLLTVLAASVALSSVAAADGYEGGGKAMAAPVVAYAWGGLYVGVGVGGASADMSLIDDMFRCNNNCRRNNPTQGVFSDQLSAGDDDWDVFGTMELGYDHLVHNRFLIGAFVNFDFGDRSDVGFNEVGTVALNGAQNWSANGAFEIEHSWDVGGRLGVLATPKLLIFASAGYTELKFNTRATMISNTGQVPFVNLSVDDDLTGYFVGGGVTYALADKVALKFEYRYADYDGESFFAEENGPGRRERNITANVDADIQSVRAVLVLRLAPDRQVVPLK